MEKRLLRRTTVETVVLLSREKVDGYVDIDLDVEKRNCPPEKEETIMDACR